MAAIKRRLSQMTERGRNTRSGPFPPFKSGTLTRRFHAEMSPMSDSLKDGELELIGIKILEEPKRKRNLQPIRSTIELWKSTRKKMMEMLARYEGIDMELPAYRDLSEQERSELPFAKMDPEVQRKLRKDYHVLKKVVEHNAREMRKYSERNPKR